MNLCDVTFAVLTKNEERNIAECLRSIPDGAEKLVLDAESTDATRAIAAANGARVATAPWRGIGPARAAAEQLCRTEWVFTLDADERVTGELGEELKGLAIPDTVDAYTVARANYFCGRWVRGAAWWPDRQVRMYRKGRARQASRNERAAAAGHIYYEAPGRTAPMVGHIVHYSYGSIDDYRRKFKLYTDLEARAKAASFAEVAQAWAAMPLRAAWLLFRHRGVLDGWQGIYVSIASALYPAVTMSKAWRSAADR